MLNTSQLSNTQASLELQCKCKAAYKALKEEYNDSTSKKSTKETYPQVKGYSMRSMCSAKSTHSQRAYTKYI